ncbi:MAG: hypothetical protein K2G85_11215 [Muribaculaceae bacterium]|nr:hypothetical protein [Muribaculaceae bacterium]
MKYLYKLSAILISLYIFCSCNDNSPKAEQAGNGIYYWRTVFSLNEYEKEFLKKHNVKKLYIKFFDVDNEWRSQNGDRIIPEATIQFKDSVPSGVNIVPTIYITTSAMEAMQLKEDVYAEKILKRINAMCRRNGIQFKELQLDCDWTKHTQKYFYKLCDEIKQLLDSTQSLSSTIRLHQLTQSPPPVDKGVLMVYNTGNLMEMTTDNSIFSRKDIAPYLRDNRLSDYPLPLDVAYPAYGWSLVFQPGKDKYYFFRIMRRTDFSSYPQLTKVNKNTYEATADINFSPDNKYEDNVYEKYRIRVERPTAKEILEVKKLIEQQLGDKPHSNILYHLDESQLSNYSDNEINKIYSRN